MDVFRGLGIVLMVMGHIGFGEKFSHFIHAFHMPMFFFISGFFYKKKEYGVSTYISKKAKALLTPYIVFGLIYWLIFIVIEGFSIEPLVHLFTINTTGLPIAGALWFLTSLFFTDIIYFLFDRWNIKWLIFLFAFVGSFVDQILPYSLPWALSASFVGLGLYWLGEWSREHEDRIKPVLNMNKWQVMSVGIIAIGLIFVNGTINMREGKYAIVPLFWVNALLAVYLGISISKQICRILKCQWLKSIGKNSIVYVCLNQVVIILIKKVLNIFLLPTVALKLLTFALSMLILYIMSLFLTRTQLKVILGKG